MRKTTEARRLVRDFFGLPDTVAVCKDDGDNTYMTDRHALVHVNCPAFPARWYMNLDEGVYKLRATGDPVRDTYWEVTNQAKILGLWDQLCRITTRRPIEETPWTRGGAMQLLIRHDHDTDRPAFANLHHIAAFRESAPPGCRVRFRQPDGQPTAAIRVTAESHYGQTGDLLGYLMPVQLSGPIGRPELTEPLQKQADAVMAAYQQHPERR